ncbi:MAG: hypothetical protein KDE24_13280 [Caldilinea sp.]|nr:hypothetical protein [Caldilinea sp.]MCB0050501.1 hypothetical protein [Caldilinea sp.]HRW49025.1 hypothetical protein [Caldilinea sp.]
MSSKSQRPHSCAIWFAWGVGILPMLLILSYTFDIWRLNYFWNEAEILAARLGNKPEYHLYLQLPLIVNGVNTQKLNWDQTDSLQPVYEHRWLVPRADDSVKAVIDYAEFEQVKSEITYAGRPITQNIVCVGVDAGTFPLWIWTRKCNGLQY